MSSTLNHAVFMPVNTTIGLIESMYQPPACRRWVFWKKDRPDGILLISDDRNEFFTTYGADACDLSARSGLMIEYHSMGGVNVPALTIPAAIVHQLATVVRLQGADIDFIY